MGSPHNGFLIFNHSLCRNSSSGIQFLASSWQLLALCAVRVACGICHDWPSDENQLLPILQVDVLIVDDWATAPMAEGERRAFLEICDARYLTRSTLLTSQLPAAKWHAQIGDPTVADSILDRLVHAAHKIERQGGSMRKKKGPGNRDDE